MRSLTLSEAINQLRNEGYKTDFNLNDRCLECNAGNIRLHLEDFVIDKFSRFEGMTALGNFITGLMQQYRSIAILHLHHNI
jgi:hypothetical protein